MIDRRRRALPFAVLFMMLTPMSAKSQVPASEYGPRAAIAASSYQVPDSSIERGVRDGEAAARGQSVGGRFVLGLLGGIPIGLYGLPLIMQQDHQPALTGSASFVLVFAAALGGSSAPDAYEPMLDAQRSPAYRTAFESAYSDELRGRRRRAGFGGGAVGAVVGLGFLLVLLGS